MNRRYSLQIWADDRWATVETVDHPDDLADARKTLHPGMRGRIVEHQDITRSEWTVPE
ncbi:hypothetical protein [Corynebacterium sp.]|uniref:hypothetical protein n=1 Tax=Corynebacterium sp. TaxID=1720 RepID=UPI0028A96C69|nr:hypothetical protein [Corynebacterium sp.]